MDFPEQTPCIALLSAVSGFINSSSTSTILYFQLQYYNQGMSKVNEKEDPVRIDLAILNENKGVLKLMKSELVYTPRKGDQVKIPIGEINRLSFKKTAVTTSTLFVNDLVITVCRAHLWAADINRLKLEK